MKDRGMRVLVNENIAATVIQELRHRGHDVLSAKESMRGAPDDVILARAQAEKRLLITQDKDFGELARVSGLPAACGVNLFRMPMPGHSRLDGASPISSWQVTIGQVIFSWPNLDVFGYAHCPDVALCQPIASAVNSRAAAARPGGRRRRCPAGSIRS